MPKMDGIDAKARKAMLNDAANPDDEPTDLPLPAAVTPAVIEAPVEAPAVPMAATSDMQALITALVTGLTQANQGTATAIRDALKDAAQHSRIPEGTDQSNPRISVYSHPLGDSVQPRTALKCPMFLAVYDENRNAVAAFEYHPDTLTEKERVAMNQVTPGEYWIERNDDQRGICLVVVQKDALGQVIRQLFAVPQGWLAKDSFAQMPKLKSFLTQLLEPASAAA